MKELKLKFSKPSYLIRCSFLEYIIKKEDLQKLTLTGYIEGKKDMGKSDRLPIRLVCGNG